MWELTSEYAGTVEFEGLLRGGWEPFSANFLNGYGGEYRTRYYFRRQVPSSGDKARDYTRTQTLKEVGKWLNEQFYTTSDCRSLLSKLQKATLEGEMPN